MPKRSRGMQAARHSSKSSSAPHTVDAAALHWSLRQRHQRSGGSPFALWRWLYSYTASVRELTASFW